MLNFSNDTELYKRIISFTKICAKIFVQKTILIIMGRFFYMYHLVD